MFRYEFQSPEGERVVFAVPEHSHGPNWDNPHLLTIDGRPPRIEEVAYWHMRWGGGPEVHQAIWRDAKRSYDRQQRAKAWEAHFQSNADRTPSSRS